METIIRMFVLMGVQILGIAKKVEYGVDINMFILDTKNTIAVMCYSEKDRKINFSSKSVVGRMKRILDNNLPVMVDNFNSFVMRVNDGDRLLKVFSGVDYKVEAHLGTMDLETTLTCDILLNSNFLTHLGNASADKLEVTGDIDRATKRLRLNSKVSN